MDNKTARAIYGHPNGHTRAELAECVRVMNALNPPLFNSTQFAAILDAHERLGIPLRPIYPQPNQACTPRPIDI